MEASLNCIMRTDNGYLLTPYDIARYKKYEGLAKYIHLKGGRPAHEITFNCALTNALHG